MILGSHNTMSYVTPLVWWRRLLRPFYRCQAKTLEGQIAAGVRWFDIRVAQDGDGRFVCAHGGTLLDADPVDARRLSRWRRDRWCVWCWSDATA